MDMRPHILCLKTKGDRAFSAAAPTPWNKLTILIRSSPALRHLNLVLKRIFILWLLSQFKVTRSYCNCVVCLLFLLIVVLP